MTSTKQALELRKELRDQLDTTLFAAMERAFDKAEAPDEIVHIPKLHIRARISGKDDLTGELARSIEQELLRQLRTMAATAGQDSPAFQTGSSGEEGTGRAGFAGLTPSAMDAPVGQSAVSLQTRTGMFLHYLETGSLPWPLAQVDTAVVVWELRDVASTGLPEVLGRLTGEPVSLVARVSFWFRWLQLLPDASWPVLAQAAPPSSVQGVRLAEIIGALSREQAGALSRYARLWLAAAAIVRARGTGGLADSGELASFVLHVLGEEGAGGPGRVGETSNAVSLSRPPGGAGSHASRPGGASENDQTAPTGSRRGKAPGGEGPSGQDSASATSGSVSRARPSDGTDSHVSASGAGRRDDHAPGGEGASGPASASATSDSVSRAQPSNGTDSRVSASRDGGVAAEETRLRTASELTARLPEPAAAAFRAWLVTPTNPPHAEAPELRAVEIGAEPRAGQPLAPRGLLHSQAVPDFAARSAPFGQRVHHAGLVLLHPFLSRFFESTAIKEPGNPALVPSVLPRAAALLHLLAVGEEEVFELELDFIKLLLGLPLDAPLPVAEGLLLASDREEVEALLSAVIGHWSVLKSTSVKGLRSTFLQRPGLIREEEQGFRLQVESAPFDMLLGQLPWGIGTVKLPWMKKAIFTEWLAP